MIPAQQRSQYANRDTNYLEVSLDLWFSHSANNINIYLEFYFLQTLKIIIIS